jgi:membrane protein implicated in regulation of membrane protease activity
MSDYLVWFILAAILAGLELLSGTLYLLLYGIACAIGGLIALVGLPDAYQYGLSAALAVIGTVWLRRRKFLKPASTTESLDIGQRVEVESWKADGTARVRYRGAGWDAELTPAAGQAGQPQVLYIVSQRGNTLIVAAEPPGA